MKTKRFLTLLSVATLAAGTFASCDKKEPEVVNPLENEYFTIENATFNSGNLPTATTDETFSVDGINNTILNGGSSIVTISSPTPLAKFFVAVQGIAGYYAVNAQAVPGTRAEGDHVYQFTLLISQNLADEFTVRVAAQTQSGDVMPEFTHEFGLLVAGTGALQVNMSFSNDKDVDLYLVLPAASGEEREVIYYGNDGVPDYTASSYTMLWGLDVDSNAGCWIDGINSENIFFPTEYVMNGTYTVYVNMYANCDPTTATSWVVTAIYNGQAINTSFGRNPANGTFPIGEESNRIDSDYTDGALKVMEFTIRDGALEPGELDFNGTRAAGKGSKK